MNVRADDCSSVSGATRALRQRVHGWAGTMQRCHRRVSNGERARGQMCWGGPHQRFRSGQRLPCARPTVLAWAAALLCTAKVQEWVEVPVFASDGSCGGSVGAWPKVPEW